MRQPAMCQYFKMGHRHRMDPGKGSPLDQRFALPVSTGIWALYRVSFSLPASESPLRECCLPPFLPTGLAPIFGMMHSVVDAVHNLNDNVCSYSEWVSMRNRITYCLYFAFCAVMTPLDAITADQMRASGPTEPIRLGGLNRHYWC